MDTIGERIKQLRVARGLSQKALADPLFTPAYISHIESGKREPSPKVLEHVADRLGITPEQLTTGRDPDLDARLELNIEQARANTYSGDLHESLAAVDEAIAQIHRFDLPKLRAKAEEVRGLILHKLGRFEEALEHYESAERLLADEPPEARAAALAGRARGLFARGNVRHAIHLLETHLIELNSRPAPDPTALLQVYSALIGPYMETGFPDRANQAAVEARRLASNVEDPEQLACMHVNLGGVLLAEGRSDEAIRSLHKAEDLFTQLGWKSEIARAGIARAMVEIDKGDLTSAEAALADALDVLEHIPNPMDKARALNQLARVARLAGRIEDAVAHLDRARILLEGGDPNERALERRERALCAAKLGELERAQDLLLEARAEYASAGNSRQVAATLMSLGDVLQELGSSDKAAAMYREGLATVVG